MSDYSSPYYSEGTVDPAHEELSSDQIESALEEFRTWLEDPGSISKRPDPNLGVETKDIAEQPDLFTLVGEFVALRHEIKLQTKSGRALMEQNSESLEHLTKTLNLLEQNQATITGRRSRGAEDLQRGYLNAIISLSDALTLADREVSRVQKRLLPVLEELVDEVEELIEFRERRNRPPLWKRLFGIRAQKPNPDVDDLPEIAKTSTFRVKQLVTSIVTGYTMSIQRLHRILGENNLQPIHTLGEPFDPELMEAVEVKVEQGRDLTEVIEEVRVGYLLDGEVFRPAQVRVAKPIQNGMKQ